MLGTLFQHLCPFGVPVGDTTWESTRLCLPQRHGAERRRILRNMLFSRMVDVALERGIERYTGVIPDPFRKEVLAMGWQAEPLGDGLAKRRPSDLRQATVHREPIPQGSARNGLAGRAARPCRANPRRTDRCVPYPCPSGHTRAPPLDGGLRRRRRSSAGVSAAIDRHAAMLARDGWCVFGRAVEPALIAGIEADLDARFAATPLCQGAFYGERTKRLDRKSTRLNSSH